MKETSRWEAEGTGISPRVPGEATGPIPLHCALRGLRRSHPGPAHSCSLLQWSESKAVLLVQTSQCISPAWVILPDGDAHSSSAMHSLKTRSWLTEDRQTQRCNATQQTQQPQPVPCLGTQAVGPS